MIIPVAIVRYDQRYISINCHNCAVILSDAIDGWERLGKLVPIIRAYSVAYFGARGAGRSAVFRKSHGKALHRSYTLKWSLDLGSSLGLACMEFGPRQ